MIKTVATALMAFTAVIPAQGQKHKVCPPLAADGTVIVKVLPRHNHGESENLKGIASRTESADGDYMIDADMSFGGKSADDRYAELKAALDEKFSYMFELKASLDRMQSEIGEKWNEYYALQEKYNHELKKIVGSWVTEITYDYQK